MLRVAAEEKGLDATPPWRPPAHAAIFSSYLPPMFIFTRPGKMNAASRMFNAVGRFHLDAMSSLRLRPLPGIILAPLTADIAVAAAEIKAVLIVFILYALHKVLCSTCSPLISFICTDP